MWNSNPTPTENCVTWGAVGEMGWNPNRSSICELQWSPESSWFEIPNPGDPEDCPNWWTWDCETQKFSETYAFRLWLRLNFWDHTQPPGGGPPRMQVPALKRTVSPSLCIHPVKTQHKDNRLHRTASYGTGYRDKTQCNHIRKITLLLSIYNLTKRTS